MNVKVQFSYREKDYQHEYELPDHRVIPHRSALPDILNMLNLTGEGVEIGVLQGEFSVCILEHWKGNKLYSIDPWKHFGDNRYMDDAIVTQSEHDANHVMTAERLSRFGSRSEILRMTSQEAAPRFRDGQLDFVYIDAQHQYEAIREDIALWLPKVRQGGILGGHDFMNLDHEGKNIFGVKRAVEELCQTKGYEYFLSVEDLSWFVIV